jgi:hypothetical protein
MLFAAGLILANIGALFVGVSPWIRLAILCFAGLLAVVGYRRGREFR